MSLVQQIKEVIALAQDLSISLKWGDDCAREGNIVEMNVSRVAQVANSSHIHFNNTFLFILLHELGHTQQPERMSMFYHINPLLAEEYAWDWASSTYRSLWGNPPEEFYMCRDYCLKSYYQVVPQFVTWG